MEYLLLLGALALIGLAALGFIRIRLHQRAGTVRAVLAPRLDSIRRSDSDEGAAGAAR